MRLRADPYSSQLTLLPTATPFPCLSIFPEDTAMIDGKTDRATQARKPGRQEGDAQRTVVSAQFWVGAGVGAAAVALMCPAALGALGAAEGSFSALCRCFWFGGPLSMICLAVIGGGVPGRSIL